MKQTKKSTPKVIKKNTYMFVKYALIAKKKIKTNE